MIVDIGQPRGARKSENATSRQVKHYEVDPVLAVLEDFDIYSII